MYTDEVKANPDSGYAHLRLARAYHANNRNTEALDELERAKALEPRSALVHHSLAEVLYSMNAFQKSTEEYKKAIELEPTLVESYVGLGWSQDRLGNYEEAVRAFKQAAIARPDLDVLQLVYLNVARILKSSDEKARRIDALRQLVDVEKQLLEMNPRAFGRPEDWLTELGDLYQELGRYDEAIQTYKEVIAISRYSEETFHAYLELASIYKKTGRQGEAAQYFDKILETTTSEIKSSSTSEAAGSAYYRLGMIFEERDQLKEALQAYAVSAARRPNSLPTHRALARMYSKTGNEQLAEDQKRIVKQLEEQAAQETRRIQDLVQKKAPVVRIPD
jgi:superkiller protein 3